MAADDTQPEDIEGTAVERVPQGRADRRAHFTLVALALLSALFFAGALAYAVGGGFLGSEGAPGDPRRAELPQQWSNLQPLEPLGPDSGGTGRTGGGRGGERDAPGRLVGSAGGPAFTATAARTPAVAAVARPVAASPIATAPRLTRRLPLLRRIVDTGRRVRLPSLDRVGVGLPDLPGGGVVDIPEMYPFPDGLQLPPIDPFPDGLQIPPIDPFPDGLEIPPVVPFPDGVQIPRVDPFPGGMQISRVQPPLVRAGTSPVGRPPLAGLLSVGGGDPTPPSGLLSRDGELLGTGLSTPRERATAPLVPPLVPLTDIDGDPPATQRRTSVAAASERPERRDRRRRRPQADRPRSGGENEGEGGRAEESNASAPLAEGDGRGAGARGRRGRPDDAEAERTHRDDGKAAGGAGSEDCAEEDPSTPGELRASLESSDDRRCEDATHDETASETEGEDDAAGAGADEEAPERVGSSPRESGT